MATLQQQVYDGEQARQVLENPAFIRAFESIEQEHVEAWKNSPARDSHGRETLWTTVKLLHKLKATLEAELSNGRMAAHELEHQTAKELREHLGAY